MKTKYIFIHCADFLKADTNIYQVFIGTSEREKRLLQKLLFLKSNPDYYFEKYSQEVADFLLRVHASFTDKPYYCCNVPPISNVSLTQLFAMLTAQCFNKQPQKPGTFMLNAMTNDEFRFKITKGYGK